MVVASSAAGVDSIAVSSSSVYWLTNTGVQSCPIAGCGSAQPASMGTNYTYNYPYGSGGLVFDVGTGDLFLEGVAPGGSSGVLLEIPGSGNAVSMGATTTIGEGGIATDASYLFWRDNGTVYRTTKAGGNKTTMMFNLAPGGIIAVDANNVYALDTGRVVRCAKGGSGCGAAPSVVATVGGNGLAVDPAGAFLYLAAGANVYRCPTDGNATAPSPWAASQGDAAAIVVDGADAYWTDRKLNRVMKCAAGATCASPTPVATSQASASSIAQDAAAVYWSLGTVGGGLLKVAK